MSAVPTSTIEPDAFHFFQQPHSEVHGRQVQVRLTPNEAEAMKRWLVRVRAKAPEDNLWITMPAVRSGVDKSVNADTPANVVHLDTISRKGMLKMLSSAARSRVPPPQPAQKLAVPERSEPNLRKRFIPLAQSRTSAVIAALDYLGQLSQRARYRYSDEEIAEIEAAILEKLQETMDAFRRGVGNRPGFQFRGASKPE